MRHHPSRPAHVFALAAGLLCVPLIVSGCAGSDSSGSGGRPPTKMTFALSTAPTALDLTKDYAGGQINSIVNDPLERLGPRDSFTPALATSVDTLNDTTFVYHIRHDVEFSNGDPLTAQDVAWSISRTFDAKSGSVLAPNLTTIKSVNATGKDQVTVKLLKPTPAARANIAYWTFVQDQKYVEAHAKDYGTTSAPPIGTGPYKVSNYNSNSVELVANPRYWGKRVPVSALKFVFISQDDTAQLAMRSGSIQGAIVGNPRTRQQWTSVPGANLFSLPNVTTTYLSLDVTTPPFNDLHVRRAIAYAVDKAGLNQAIFNGQGQLLNSLVPVEGYEDVAPSSAAAQSLADSLPKYTFDMAKAKSELQQSAYSKGFSFTLPYEPNFEGTDQIAQSLKQNLASIGVKVNLKPLSDSQWASQFYAHKDLGAQLMPTFGIIPQDPSGGLLLLVGKANAVANGFNSANYYPSDVESAYQTVSTSIDNPARWAGVQTILRDVARDVPYVPMFSSPTFVVLGGGFKFAGELSNLDLYNGNWPFHLN